MDIVTNATAIVFDAGDVASLKGVIYPDTASLTGWEDRRPAAFQENAHASHPEIQRPQSTRSPLNFNLMDANSNNIVDSIRVTIA